MLLSVNRNAVLRTDVIQRSAHTAPLSTQKWCRQPCVHIEDSVPAWNESPLTGIAEPAERRGPQNETSSIPHPGMTDSLYLFARYMEWEQEEEPTAGWELLAAAMSSHSDTRAHARALLSKSRHFANSSSFACSCAEARAQALSLAETDMNVPYGIPITEKCSECAAARSGFFCKFSESTLAAWDGVTHTSTLPAGAILFVEGQSPRGMFVICSGRVNLSTTSKEGKLLLLKTAESGEVLGLSATISGLGYEVTAETATPCQVSFVDRNHTLELMQTCSEFSMQAAQYLSRGFHEAYRDIHGLMLSKTSAGKLARLLLAQSPLPEPEGPEIRIPTTMTHEEMAHRIGASRETVTRLLTNLKRKHLIRLDGPTLVIRDRTALEALTI